jgi:hypothetical protein
VSARMAPATAMRSTPGQVLPSLSLLEDTGPASNLRVMHVATKPSKARLGPQLARLLPLGFERIPSPSGLRQRFVRESKRIANTAITRNQADPGGDRPEDGGGRRAVVLMPQLAKLLREHRMASPYKAETDFVFPAPGGRGRDHRSTGRAVERAVKRAGLGEGVSFHGLPARVREHADRRASSRRLPSPLSGGGRSRGSSWK